MNGKKPKKETRKTLKLTGQSVYPPTCTNCSHGYDKNEWERFFGENNQENRPASEKVDHLQTVRQLIEKYNELNRPLYIETIDYEKAFDSIEYQAIFKALKTICINETYITLLEDIYRRATARMRMDNQA